MFFFLQLSLQHRLVYVLLHKNMLSSVLFLAFHYMDNGFIEINKEKNDINKVRSDCNVSIQLYDTFSY